MYLSKEIYNLKTILGMLDIAISEMAENSCCYYCSNKDNKALSPCIDEDLCKSYLFEGILKKLKKEEFTIDETN